MITIRNNGRMKLYGKWKLVPVLKKVLRHGEVWGSGGINPRILNLGTGCI